MTERVDSSKTMPFGQAKCSAKTPDYRLWILQNKILPFWCFRRMSLPACLMANGVDSVMQMVPVDSSRHRLLSPFSCLPSSEGSRFYQRFVAMFKRDNPWNSDTQYSSDSFWLRIMPKTPPVSLFLCKVLILPVESIQSIEPSFIPVQIVPFLPTAKSSGKANSSLSDITIELSKVLLLILASKAISKGGKLRVGASQSEQSSSHCARSQTEQIRSTATEVRSIALSI